jgi:hypothetical protein
LPWSGAGSVVTLMVVSGSSDSSNPKQGEGGGDIDLSMSLKVLTKSTLLKFNLKIEIIYVIQIFSKKYITYLKN